MKWHEANQHIRTALPQIRPMLDYLGPIELPQPSLVSIPEAVVKIVIGQMLSNSAARAIYSRVSKATESAGTIGSWLLQDDVLLSCGLSKRKVRTIREFSEAYNGNAAMIEVWPSLEYEELVEEVSRFWGLSIWTADMLAIFHFGHGDVFPASDGSIKRAMEQAGITFGIDENDWRIGSLSPHRTYFSLCLWKSIDVGYWSK
jgi:DNA-3-methyladenine glycosylase II